jgi:hypothetical protein
VIVVIGSPIGRLDDGRVRAGGMASRVALAAARDGRVVQLVGKTGDDPTADGVVLDLAGGGVGHVALLRDAGRATPLEAPAVDAVDAVDDGLDPAVDAMAETGDERGREGPLLDAADVDLGLRYLTEFAVVVMAEPAGPGVVTVIADAARWGGARMVLVVGPGETAPDGMPTNIIVLEAPDADPDGVFASMVGTLAAALDAGTDPGVAFRASIAADGWTVAAKAGAEADGVVETDPADEPGATPAAR